MTIIDGVIILIILLCGVLGLKRGVIKSLVQLVGTVSIVIVAYVFKDTVADFLMGFMPFFNFGGIFDGITSMNILMYEMISFVVIFILLYCILNILLTLSGVIELLLKFTVVLAIPSKILGGIVGLLEGVVLAFMISFVMLHMPVTEKYVVESKFATVILERTPYIGTVMAKTTLALEDINEIVKEMKDVSDRKEVDARVLQTLLHYQIVNENTVKELIKDDKLHLDNVSFG